MSTFKNGLLGAAITALTITVGLVAFTGASHATTFGQTSDDSTNHQVGTNAANNVTVTDLGTGYLDITVNLATNWGLVNTGASGNGGSFVFGLSGISSLTFTPVVPTTFEDPAPGTWYPTGSTVATASSNPVTVSSASFSAPGKFLYSSGYGLSYESNGGSSPFPSIEFTITNSTVTPTLTLAIFLADLQSSTTDSSTGLCTTPSSGCFYADVQNADSKTGLIDFGLTTGGGGSNPTPIPAALPLFASGLGALGLLGWRRKRKGAAALAAA